MSNIDMEEVLSLNDPGSDPDDDTFNTRNADEEQLSNLPAKRRSVCLSHRQAFISDWPIARILDTLFNRNITVSTGLSHQDIFSLFLALF